MKLPKQKEDTHFEALQTFPKLDRICLGAEWVILGMNPALIPSRDGAQEHWDLLHFPSGSRKGIFQNSTHKTHTMHMKSPFLEKKRHLCVFILPYSCIFLHYFSAHVEAENLNLEICRILIIQTLPRRWIFKVPALKVHGWGCVCLLRDIKKDHHVTEWS